MTYTYPKDFNPSTIIGILIGQFAKESITEWLIRDTKNDECHVLTWNRTHETNKKFKFPLFDFFGFRPTDTSMWLARDTLRRHFNWLVRVGHHISLFVQPIFAIYENKGFMDINLESGSTKTSFFIDIKNWLDKQTNMIANPKEPIRISA